MLDMRHSVIIQGDETIFIFYRKWFDHNPKQELFRYLIMDLVGKEGNTWDIDLTELFHLTDPE